MSGLKYVNLSLYNDPHKCVQLYGSLYKNTFISRVTKVILYKHEGHRGSLLLNWKLKNGGFQWPYLRWFGNQYAAGKTTSWRQPKVVADNCILRILFVELVHRLCLLWHLTPKFADLRRAHLAADTWSSRTLDQLSPKVTWARCLRITP